VLAVLFLLLGLTRESREVHPASVDHPGVGG